MVQLKIYNGYMFLATELPTINYGQEWLKSRFTGFFYIRLEWLNLQLKLISLHQFFLLYMWKSQHENDGKSLHSQVFSYPEFRSCLLNSSKKIPFGVSE